mmetsp:Transcript_4535/g.13136  ORF Transcript_4535/g.13136 Transcript_4535/m.13136 type:complete len:301 (-) Transcript_4535:77-979(-)
MTCPNAVGSTALTGTTTHRRCGDGATTCNRTLILRGLQTSLACTLWRDGIVNRSKWRAGWKRLAAARPSKSTDGQWATTMASAGAAALSSSALGLRTRNTAGSGFPALPTISAPTTSQTTARRSTSASLALPPLRRIEASTACNSRRTSCGADNCNADNVPAPDRNGKAHILRKATWRSPTATVMPAEPPHSNRTCCMRSTLSASHSSRDRNSMLADVAGPPGPAAICPGTTRASATPRARRRARQCSACSRVWSNCSLKASASRNFSASLALERWLLDSLDVGPAIVTSRTEMAFARVG